MNISTYTYTPIWKSTNSVCGTRPDKEADGKVQVDGDCTKFTHPSYYDHVVDGDDRHFFQIDLGNTFYIYSEEGRIYSSGPPSIFYLWYPWYHSCASVLMLG